MSYNITLLADTTNPVQWFIIFNFYSNYLLIAGLLVILSFIILGLAKAGGNSTKDSFVATSFVMFLISIIGWLIRYNEMYLVPSFLPVIFAIFTVVGIFMLIVDKVFQS